MDLVLFLLEHCFLYRVSLTSQQHCESRKMIPITLGRDEDLEQQSHREGILLGKQEAASVFGFQWSPPP